LAAGRTCGAYQMEEEWLDVGTPSSLRQARGGGVT
jgi:NDP-sugar pyrophosphorylase family protein